MGDAPPSPSALPPPQFAGAAAPKSADPLELLATQLQTVLGMPGHDGGMDIAQLTKSFQKTFRKPLTTREHGAPSVRSLLLKQGTSLGVDARVANGSVWVTLMAPGGADHEPHAGSRLPPHSAAPQPTRED